MTKKIDSITKNILEKTKVQEQEISQINSCLNEVLIKIKHEIKNKKINI